MSTGNRADEDTRQFIHVRLDRLRQCLSSFFHCFVFAFCVGFQYGGVGGEFVSLRNLFMMKILYLVLLS